MTPDPHFGPTYEQVIASLGLTDAELAAKGIAPTLTEALWRSDREARRQAWELMQAGWRFELPASPDPQVGSWYWRRQPRRKNSKGMFFRSTQQAYNALTREREGTR